MNALSTRARHVLVHAVYPTTGDDYHPWAANVAPRVALRLLRRRAKDLRCSVRHVILRARGGGHVTCHELLAWMGLPEDEPHVHVCRDCGQKMGNGS
jgi:hypothetical protein